MATQKTALVAFHDDEINQDYTRFFERKGYLVSTASSIDEMLERMGIPKNAPLDLKPSNPYSWYFMDTNLELPNYPTCEPAQRIYNHVRTQIAEGISQFMSFTGNNEAQRLAKHAGVPVLSKSSSEVFSFHDSIKREQVI